MLESLDLAGNNVHFGTTFTSFEHIPNLKHLDLSSNQLYSFDRSVVEPLVQLETLNLQFNNIESIASDLFSMNRNLKAVLFLNNSLTFDNDVNIFRNLYDLEKYEISNCKVGSLGENSFVDKKHLRSVTIRNCDVQLISSTAFNNEMISKLEDLDISGSVAIWKFTRHRLPTAANKLQKLQLDNLNLQRIPFQFFQHMPQLKFLSMANNDITYLERGDLFGLKQEEIEIHLENNHINTISPYILHGTSPPVKLYLTDNKLTSLSFINDNLCSFDRSTIDLTGNFIDCDCSTAHAVQSKVFANLIGNCRDTLSGSKSGLNHFSGLKLAPKFGRQAHGDRSFLEVVALDVCADDFVRRDRGSLKFDCCSDSWVTVGMPAACAVRSNASVLYLEKLLHFIIITFLYAKLL